jgi:hypothetical protein
VIQCGSEMLWGIVRRSVTVRRSGVWCDGEMQ